MRRKRGLSVVVLVAAAAVVAPESPAHADPQQPWALRTIAGGPGQGVATSLATRPQAIAFRPTDHKLLILGDKLVRSLDLTTGTVTNVAGTGLDQPLTEQTHTPPAPAVAGPARLESIGEVDHMFVRPDGSAVLSGYDASNWVTFELSAANRIRSAQCCNEYQTQVVPDGAGGYYYTDNLPQIRRRAADGSDAVAVGSQYGSSACPVGPALSTSIDTNNIAQMTLDADGNLVFAEPECVVRYDTATGNLVRLAGSDTGTGSTGDGGPAVSAHLDPVRGIAYDAAGDLFIATGPEVREVDTNGTITTVAGNGTPATGYYGTPNGPAPRDPATIGDGGPAVAASMDATGVAVDGNRLAIIDHADNRVRLVSPIAPSATINTVAGNGWMATDNTINAGPYGHSLDGPALDAQIAPFGGVATAPDGTRYVATRWNTIAALGVDGVVRNFAGNGVPGDSADGSTAATSALYAPADLAVGTDGTVYFVDHYTKIRAVTPAGTLTTVVGGGTNTGDGVAAASAQIAPDGRMAVDAQGRVFWPEYYDGDTLDPRIRMWSPSNGLVTTVAGGGNSTSDGLALSAQLSNPLGLALTPDGRLLFGDAERLRAVVGAGTPSAVVSTIAGVAGSTTCTAPPGGSGSVAAQSVLSEVYDVVASPGGDIYFVDGGALERIDAQGQLTLVAGQRCYGHPAPFDAVGNDRAAFYGIPSTGLDTDGEPLVVDHVAARIYRATPDHVLPAPVIGTVSTSSTQLQVAWWAPTVPADSSGVRTYTVDAEPGHHVAVVYATTTQVVLRGLTNGVTYSVSVTAQNTAGDSAPSSSVQATPGADPPSAPRQLWVAPLAGALVVHFQPPLHDGGSAVTSYVATAMPGNVSVTVGAGAESATIRGLAHTAYTVTVRATNAAGPGAAAATSGTPYLSPALAHGIATSPRTHVVLSRTAGVRDVDTADFALTDAKGHRLAVVVQCLSGSGVVVSCDQQVAVRIVVTPSAKLSPGARYSLTVNPTGDAYPITDVADNAVPRFGFAFVAGSAG
ncbi:MAG: large repetitive protein [Frankiaceae bacterium]|jgi:hypothetical protein|nr:large repetitive protein [Frankiaceae bacterium]